MRKIPILSARWSDGQPAVHWRLIVLSCDATAIYAVAVIVATVAAAAAAAAGVVIVTQGSEVPPIRIESASNVFGSYFKAGPGEPRISSTYNP